MQIGYEEEDSVYCFCLAVVVDEDDYEDDRGER